MSRAARGAWLLVAAALIGLGLVVAEPALTPAEAAGCDAAQIAVVVSFNSLGGGTQSSCIGDVGSGLAALSTAGFSYTFVDRQPGLVCTINNAPNPCNGAPTNAYWSYWTASLGGSWSYSNLGAGSSNPAPGSAEGWSFGAGSPPAVEPPGVNAPPPPPPPPPAPVPPPIPGGGSGGGGSSPSSAPDGSGSGPGSTGADPGTPSGESSTDSGASGESSSAAGAQGGSRSTRGDAAALQPVSDSTASGTPWAVVATLAGLALLGGAAYWQQRRRRHAPPGAGV